MKQMFLAHLTPKLCSDTQSLQHVTCHRQVPFDECVTRDAGAVGRDGQAVASSDCATHRQVALGIFLMENGSINCQRNEHQYIQHKSLDSGTYGQGHVVAGRDALREDHRPCSSEAN